MKREKHFSSVNLPCYFYFVFHPSLCPPPSSSFSVPYPDLLPGEHAYKCSWCSFSTMTISQLKEHSLKVHGKSLTLPRPRIVSLLSSHTHHASPKATPAEEVEDSNGKNGLPSQNEPLRVEVGWDELPIILSGENLTQKNMAAQVKEEM